MGQRHQLFLIARVRPRPGERKEYRCVAAFHHQWCYGRLPLRCVSRFRHLAKVKANADLIRRDLDNYHLGVERSDDIPCPYISFLASMAFSLDIEGDYAGNTYISNVCYEPASMGSMEGDNNDGITVIDISAPCDLAYCFVSICGLEGEEDNLRRGVPLTATQYLRAYYPMNLDPSAGDGEQMEEAYNAKCIKDLDSMSVLTLDVLIETWPHEYSRRIRMPSYFRRGPSTDWDGIGLSLEPIDSLSSDDTPSECGGGSVQVSKDSLVDLSNHNILPNELFDTLEGLPSFTRLDISHNAAVDKATVTQILQRHRLKWLNIDGCNISKDDITDLLASQPSLFRGVEAIIHPLFLSVENLDSYTIREEVEPPSISCALRIRYDNLRRLCLPFFGIDQLIQSLFDFAEAHGRFPPDNAHAYRSSLGFHNLQGLFGYPSRGDGQPWREREVQMIPPEANDEDTERGYQFVFVTNSSSLRGYSSKPVPTGEGYRYGIILPGGERKFVDLATFFGDLEEVGWPKITNQKAAAQVLEIYRKGTTLLEDVDAVMTWLDTR
ncbi:hypothetical protein NMY22_g6559 [Coprinellus aureogranulatus]|nr:hypothetical protein NMY22_g6559 [Coprinellus aureogranulatus]